MSVSTPTPPTVRPPAPFKGWTAARSQRWVMVAALVVAGSYTIRHVTSPISSSSSKGSTLSKAVGDTLSIPSFLIAYGVGFFGLSILAMGLPELGAAFAALIIVGTVMSNGIIIASDIGTLQSTAQNPPPLPKSPSTPSPSTSSPQPSTTTKTPSTQPPHYTITHPNSPGSIGHRNSG